MSFWIGGSGNARRGFRVWVYYLRDQWSGHSFGICISNEFHWTGIWILYRLQVQEDSQIPDQLSRVSIHADCIHRILFHLLLSDALKISEQDCRTYICSSRKVFRASDHLRDQSHTEVRKFLKSNHSFYPLSYPFVRKSSSFLPDLQKDSCFFSVVASA